MKLNAPDYWYKPSFFCYLLAPFACLYRLIVATRCLLYKYGIKKVTKFEIPIIIVGNITVGGTGKTPLVIWLAKFLRNHGFRPGIISRGYGGHNTIYPYEVNNNSNVAEVGEEALLIKRRTQCPMVVAPHRVKAVQKLLETSNCNIVISDDGLQHYALGRDIEIAVIDAERCFGNGFCLPAGPLREPIKRLQEVDFIVETSKSMQLLPNKLYNITNPDLTKTLSKFGGKTVHAIAGIGNPQRFFKMLSNNNIKVIEHPFPDHYAYRSWDLTFNDKLPILMTEKDAVKCEQFADQKYWCVPVSAKLDNLFAENFLSKLKFEALAISKR
jgi:tetraacyldisaccharide 4'-kinase